MNENTLALDKPHDNNAEKLILAAVLLDAEEIYELRTKIKPSDFFIPLHREIFEAMLKISDEQRSINQVTLHSELLAQQPDEAPKEIYDYITSLIENISLNYHLKEATDIVLTHSVRRQLMNYGEIVSESCADSSKNVEKLLTSAEEGLLNIRLKSEQKAFVHVSSPLKELFTSRNGFTSGVINTGYKRLDAVLNGGLHHSDLIVVAARPSVGKSMFAINLAYKVASNEKLVAVFSLEMSCEQIATRLLSMASGLTNEQIRMSNFSQTERDNLIKLQEYFENIEIYIDQSPLPSVADIHSKLARLKNEKKGKLDLVIVDYLQLIVGKTDKRDINRTQEVSGISRDLKALARDFNVPVIAISQLSRAIESRRTRSHAPYPMLSDLRESGSIEQDADVVIFLHREDKSFTVEQWQEAKPALPYPKGLVKVIIAKHRHAGTDTIDMVVRDDVSTYNEGGEYETKTW